MMPHLTLLGLLRTIAVLVAALAAATLLPRLGVPPSAVPDLVVIVVSTSAVVRGSVHGALLGLAGGWVVELMPPGGHPLGLVALLYCAAGAAAGVFSRPGRRAVLAPLSAVALAACVVEGGRLLLLLRAGASLDVPGAATRVLVTIACALVLAPLAVGVDRALVRRRLA